LRVKLAPAAPTGWNIRITHPLLSEGFAEAARALAYTPAYVADDRDAALVLIRSVPLVVLNQWTRRAKVYVDRGDVGFLADLLNRLRGHRIAHVKVNDERHGLAGAIPGHWRGAIDVARYVFLIDVADRSDADLLAGMDDPVPRNIRKAQRAGVTIDTIRTAEGLREFCTLMRETSERMRSRHVAAVYPNAFFERVFHYMVPTGQALFLLAHADGVPLAGQMYLVTPSKLTYYHGASTRDRALTAKHGPSALFWHAIRLARERGIPVFDFGGANPTSDPNDVHFSVTDFKRRWGGRHVLVPTAEVVLSPMKVAFQDRVLKPFWDRAHPLFLRMFPRAA
jgi:hypothetical protein